MPSKAITDKQGERPPASSWHQGPEVGPSVVREDDMSIARLLGTIGAVLAVFGGFALVLNLAGKNNRIGPAWSSILLALGLVQLLFHAASDRDLQIRRVYLAFAFLALVVGAFLCVLPYPRYGAQFGSGYVLMTLALLFALAVHRVEEDDYVRNLLELVLGGAGALMVAVGLIGGNLKVDFLLPYGLLLAILGMVYIAAFVATRGVSNDLAYRAGVGLAATGALFLLIALGRSILPTLFFRWKWTTTPPAEYFIPQGLLLTGIGTLYLLVALGLCSERPLAVLTRRELGAFFYSPMAYLVLLGFAGCSWWSYADFVALLSTSGQPNRRPIFDPIVRLYFYNLIPVIALVFVVPVLTMRLLSEEKRAGTYEVLMTAPVSETTVVYSKFLAAFLMFMVIWLPFGLYLLALPLGGAQSFDYRPLLSFFLVLAITGAGFISMGLFFSSLTSNQIASAVMTFLGMSMFLAILYPQGRAEPGSAAEVIWTHLSFLNVWLMALDGKIVPKYLTFFLSMPFLFLFLTVKVLEARKWR